MKPIALIAEATTQEGDVLGLYSHDSSYFLQVNGVQIRSSFASAAEEELGRLGCAAVKGATKPRVLIGGLGLGYTLAAAREALPQKGAQFVVAEPVPDLLKWNRTHLRELHPGLWDDPRITVQSREISELLSGVHEAFQVILLEPEGALLEKEGQEALLSPQGLGHFAEALKQGGILAIRASVGDSSMEKRLREAGFEVSQAEVPTAHRGKMKRKHTIWLARNGQYQSRRSTRLK